MPQQAQAQLTSAIYIHIPFCNSICPYCAFYKLPWSRENEVQFLDAILKELDFYKTTHPTIQVTSLFIGGGTPSALSVDILDPLLNALHTTFDFPSGIEKTCEMNPESIKDENLEILKKHGINRISMGVQSFNQTELTYLGRTHSIQTVFDAVEKIKHHQFKNWNLDLIFSTAPSTVESLTATLKTAIALNPPHISAYSLSIESGTAFEKRNIPWPEDDPDKAQYDHLIQTMTDAGYHQYEVSNFAKPGYECTHNLTYWTLDNYIGIGPSAVSYYNGYHYQNPRDLAQYINSPEPSMPAEPESTLSQLNDALTSILRLREGMDINRFNARFNIDFTKERASELSAMRNNQLIEQTPTHIKTTLKGQLVLDSILERLIY